MLYIFDLGNVVVDIDFSRALGAWSHYSGVPLAVLRQHFTMGRAFEQHERGEISDEAFAQALCHELGITLSFEQFAAGWQAIFVDVRAEVLEIMHQLRRQGNRVVILSNTNNLHTQYWPQQFPLVEQAVDALYLSQDLGMRKPEPAIYHEVLKREQTRADLTVFFDDVPANIEAARAVGIEAVLVTDRQVIPDWFARQIAREGEPC